MIITIIKFYFLYLCTTYISLKLINFRATKQSHQFFSCFFPLLLAITAYFLRTYSVQLGYIVPMLMLWIFIGSTTHHPKISFISNVVAYGISYSFLALSSFLALIVIFPFSSTKTNFHYLPLSILSSVFQLIFSFGLFQIKRFKKGMPFLFTGKHINIVTILSFSLIPFNIFSFANKGRLPMQRLFTALLFTATIAFLIHWWQAQITKSYKQALINRELESLRMELTEKEKQLVELAARNEELGRLIHKDNKRIPAMEHAVSEFLVMDLSDKEKAVERANTLLIEIQKLSEDRNNTVTEIYARKYKHHDTGIPELDTMLNYMEKRAYGEHIKLSIQSAVDLRDLVPNTISAEDLSHVLSDLLENAIIASKQITSPAIQLQFYQTGKDFVIEIADNGIAFETASLVNFGLEQLTTHADTGGSGIGLMDIWKIKEKYGISLHITEYKEDTPYTKKIALIFNKKNRYTISTERKEELLALSKRTDLQVF